MRILILLLLLVLSGCTAELEGAQHKKMLEFCEGSDVDYIVLWTDKQNPFVRCMDGRGTRVTYGNN